MLDFFRPGHTKAVTSGISGYLISAQHGKAITGFSTRKSAKRPMIIIVCNVFIGGPYGRLTVMLLLLSLSLLLLLSLLLYSKRIYSASGIWRSFPSSHEKYSQTNKIAFKRNRLS